MEISLKDILPNPNRNFTINPLDEVRIEKLVESINATGFWENVAVRKNSAGKYEIVYGHHRIKAAQIAGLKTVDVKVLNLNDTEMLERMSRDNDPAYDSTFLHVIETVYAAVQGLANGTQKPFVLPEKTKLEYIMYAPSFVPGVSAPESGAHPYTAIALAQRLGYTRKQGKEGVQPNLAAETALDILMLVELGKLKDFSAFRAKGMTANAAAEIIKAKLALLKEEAKNKKEEALKAKAEAVRAKIEAEQKAFREAEKAKALEAFNKREALKKAEREAKRKEEEAEAARIAEQRARMEEAEKLRALKANVKMAEAAMSKYSVGLDPKEGATVEKTLKEAKDILDSKSSKEADAVAEKLLKVAKKITDTYLVHQKQEQRKVEEERTVNAAHQHTDALINRIMGLSLGKNTLWKELDSLSRNSHLDTNDRERVRQALLTVSETFREVSSKFLPPVKENTLDNEAKRSSKTPSLVEDKERAQRAKKVQNELEKAAEERAQQRAKENEEISKEKKGKKK